MIFNLVVFMVYVFLMLREEGEMGSEIMKHKLPKCYNYIDVNLKLYVVGIFIQGLLFYKIN